MIHRERFLAMMVCGMFVALVSLPVRTWAQCPEGWRSCLAESSQVWCVPPGAQCGIPDSGSVECAGVCIVDVVPLRSPRSIGMRLTFPVVESVLPGAQLEAVVRTERPAPFEVAIVRHGDGKWVFRAAAVTGRTPASGTIRLLSRGQALATRDVAANANVAEAAGLPSSVAVESSTKGTAIRWTYSAATSARLHGASGKSGNTMEVDAVEIRFASGDTGPVRALELRGMGIGQIAYHGLASGPATK